jgi:hypothetical protein
LRDFEKGMFISNKLAGNLYRQSIMTSKFRRHPLACIGVTVFRLITGKLRLSKQFIGEIIEMDDLSSYKIFRHITDRKVAFNSKNTVFIVSFKFAHLSHRGNKIASIIPMLMITGFPGFVKKIYAVNPENGFWQGMYQWESSEHLEDYKKSLVFKVMNKRAIPGTINSIQFQDKSLDSFINEKVRN